MNAPNKSIQKRLKIPFIFVLALIVYIIGKSSLLFFVETGFVMNYLLEEPVKDLSRLQKDLKPALILKISPEDAVKIKRDVDTKPNFFSPGPRHNYMLICDNILLFSKAYVVFCSDNPNQDPKRVAWPVMCRLDKLKGMEIKGEVVYSLQNK